MMGLHRPWLLALAIGFTMAATTWAGTPVFDYQFPASFDGTTSTCTDLSAAGNNALINSDLTHTGYAADVRPPEFTSGGSLHGADQGYGWTYGTFGPIVDLLDNSVISPNGGYSMDVWINPADLAAGTTAPAHIICYAGTDGIRLARSGAGTTADPYTYKFLFTVNNTAYRIYSEPVNLGQWYHVKASFDTIGIAQHDNGVQVGYGTLIVDDGTTQSVSRGRMVKAASGSDAGDSYDRPIGLNNWAGNLASQPPTATAVHQGYLFNPRVSLGPHEDADVSSLFPDPAGVGNTVAHWTLDDAAGATTVLDSGSHGLHGAPLGGVTLGQPGAASYSVAAANLTGATGTRIVVPHDASMESNSFTVAFWVKPSASITSIQQLLDNRDAVKVGGQWVIRGYTMYADTYGYVKGMFGDGGSAWTTLSGGEPLAMDTWSHVAMAYDAESKVARMYMNGVLKDMLLKGGNDYSPNSNSSTSLSFGALAAGGSEFAGDMDDVWLFDYALTGDQIATLISDGTPPPPLQIPGDATGDGIVNAADAARLATNWGTSSATWSMGDFNKDGIVNAADASILAANWDYGTAEGAVPEPSSVALLLGLAGLVCLRRRR